jgi:hypothetical protein
MDAALVRPHERAADDVACLVLQLDVVERQFESLLRAVDERRDLARDVQRRLAAVGKSVNLDQGCCFARSDALCARFFAW